MFQEARIFSGDFFLVSDPFSDSPFRSRGVTRSYGGHGLNGAPEFDANHFTAHEVLQAAQQKTIYTAEGIKLGDLGEKPVQADEIAEQEAVKIITSTASSELVYDVLHEIWLERVAALRQQNTSLPQDEVLV